ncbi:MAG: carboxylating nicotinate-nucleotide diphosphorylase [Bacteroidetes bacterium]|nr:carboxylating nicotinate-nucleotide diphosphorylase [Bacteroidota bacterium]
MKLDKKEIDKIISCALTEDVGSGDVTTNLIVPKNEKSRASFYAKENGVIAGLTVAKSVFTKLDKKSVWKSFVKEGDRVNAGTRIAEVSGSYRALLTGERTALNMLQRLSGIATQTSEFVRLAEGTKVRVLDTRKTVPGLRTLDKYAVKIGGGENHRFGLYDMVLIKDNHIKAAGGITSAVERIRKNLKTKIRIEVETSNLDEVCEAVNCNVDIIMLDNMTNDAMKEAVRIINGKIKVEASGNITVNNFRQIAEIGVDYISIGALTHSVKALDINMKIENLKERL